MAISRHEMNEKVVAEETEKFQKLLDEAYFYGDLETHINFALTLEQAQVIELVAASIALSIQERLGHTLGRID